MPPSIRKHSDTHNDPFRTIIQGADKILRNATGFFCVGYGFNDDHIQVKLLDRATRDRKRIVLLTRTLSEKAQSLLLGNYNQLDFVAFEKAGDDGTTMYSRDHKGGIFMEGHSVWDLRHFVKEIIL